jgi:hypothetical protein
MLARLLVLFLGDLYMDVRHFSLAATCRAAVYITGE